VTVALTIGEKALRIASVPLFNKKDVEKQGGNIRRASKSTFRPAWKILIYC
jgi:hypothetical protein